MTSKPKPLFIEETFIVPSSSDNLSLSCLLVSPQTQPRAIMQLAHGMQEHKERYIPFMRFLAEHGIACIIHDHRGHGGSIKKNEDLGYFYDTTATYVVEDLLDVAQAAQDLLLSRFELDCTHIPHILFGHSMGTLVVRKYLKTHDKLVDGVILCGAPGNNPSTNMGLHLVNFLAKVKGATKPSPLITALVFGGSNKGLPGTHRLRWLSANEDNVAAYEADELCGVPFTLNGYQNLLGLLRDSFEVEGWEIENPNMPILFIAGEDDPITLGTEAFNHSQQFLRDRGYKHVTGKLYPGLRHELLNEKEAQEAYDDVLAFAEAIISEKRKREPTKA